MTWYFCIEDKLERGGIVSPRSATPAATTSAFLTIDGADLPTGKPSALPAVVGHSRRG